MTIRELERRTGLERANIRFYEKEGLLSPERKENGYREYSEADRQLLLKIKLLRRLDFSIEAIRSLIDGNTDLEQALERRLQAIGMQRRELNATEQVCQEMKDDRAVFSTMDAQRYLDNYDRALRLPAAPSAIRPTVPASDRVRPVRCPWRRYFARVLDHAFGTLILWMILSLVFRVNFQNIGGVGEWLLGYVEWLIWLPLEGLLLSRWGTTPGKWLMGIRVEHEDGRKLTYGEAIDRAWQVFVKGMGALIPIYNIIRLWKSYKAVRDGDDDELEWEWNTNSVQVVREQDCPGWRPVAYAGAYAALIFVLVAVGLFPGFHPPHRGSQLTVEEFVKNYNSMARFHGYTGDELQMDGTFGIPPEWPASELDAITIDLEEDLVLRFEETDGVLTKVSFERDLSYWSYWYHAGSVDSEGKRAVVLTAMAYAWADCGPGQAYRSQELLEEFAQWEEGTLDKEILGCRLTYTVAPMGVTVDDDGDTLHNWHVEFEFVPNP